MREEPVGTKHRYLLEEQVYQASKTLSYAEWTQESIEPTVRETVPAAVGENHSKMLALLTAYEIEFYDLVTPEKLRARGVA